MTAPEWTPERTITPELAAEVITAQFPALAGQPVREFGAGWDNVVLAVGEEWLFRFIHRAVALDGARRELAVLRHLADPFALRVPHPVWVGTPTPAVGWPFWGTRLIAGTELADAGIPDDARTGLAADVGRFLRVLHDPDLAASTAAACADAGVPLPVDPLRRGDAADVVRRLRGWLPRLAARGLWAPDEATDDLLARAGRLGGPTDEDGPPVLVHGDLHVRHVLVGPDGAACGVIDWGDTALADPAVDLMIAFAAFRGDARRALLDAYGPVGPDRETRARVMALYASTLLAEHGAAEGRTSLRDEALAGMARAVT